MNKVNNLIILQKSQSLPDNLRTVFREKGFETHTAFEAKTILQKIDELSMAYIIMDCGERAGAINKILKDIREEPEAALFPTIFMCRPEQAPSKEWQESFLSFRLLPYPCSSDDVLTSIQYFDRNLESYLRKLKDVAPHRCPKSIGTNKEAISKTEKTNFIDVSGPLFAELQNNESFKKPLGGSLFSKEITFDILETRSLVPEDKALRKIIDDVLTDIPMQAHPTLFRRIYIGGQTTSILPVNKELQTAGLMALYNLANGFKNDLHLLSLNYLNQSFPDASNSVATCIRKSAESLSRSNLKDTSILLKNMSHIVSGSKFDNDERSLVASTLVAADMADRACRENGSWHPRLAYVYLSKLSNGHLANLHPTSLALVLKFIAETIGTTEPLHLIPKQIRYNTKLLEAHKSARAIEPENGEHKVALAKLTPGMRLSRPLISYEGKTLIQEDVVLDDDMILRLWRLAAIKVLNTPAMIVAV